MRARTGRAALVVAVGVTFALVGCAGRRLDRGVYRSEHGYRITIPGPAWNVVEDSRADLELRREDGRVAMLVSATCGATVVRRQYADLARHLLLGLRDRETLENAETSLAGHGGVHMVMEGRMQESGRVRIETYTVKDDRCVYDLLYVAPPADFDSSRDDFARFVRSFVTE
jgi:hypothetical protein